MSTKLFDTYQTGVSLNPISLNVKIGYAQLGSTSVTIDNVQLIAIPPADMFGNYQNDFTITLGANANLKGKLLEIQTDVAILMQPTASSVIIELLGGAISRTYMLNSIPEALVSDVITYYASISLI